MAWIRKHSLIVAGVALGGTLTGGIVSAAQMSHYDNYSTANWLVVLAWFGASAATCIAGLRVAASPAEAIPQAESVAVESPPAKTALERVRALREWSIASRQQADDVDAIALKAIAAMEAELIAAKALMEVPS